MADTTNVTVLATLHHLHGAIEWFDFDDLAQIIRTIAPDFLGVELTPADLAARREQPIKQEYQNSVYPLLDEHGFEAFPLEPPEPKYSQLVAMGKSAREGLSQRSPDAEQCFGHYVQSLYDTLFEWWQSPFDVNSEETDRHFEIKHKFQNAVYGPDEQEGWDKWNQHFLDQILDVSSRQAGARVLVLVGVEHAYWLRKRLRAIEGIRLVDMRAYMDES